MDYKSMFFIGALILIVSARAFVLGSAATIDGLVLAVAALVVGRWLLTAAETLHETCEYIKDLTARAWAVRVSEVSAIVAFLFHTAGILLLIRAGLYL